MQTIGIACFGAFLALQTPAAAQDTAPSLSTIVEAWRNSPHADSSTEAFRHWDEEGEIPGTCAVCHSSVGAAEYMGGAMETIGALDHPVPIGTTVNCVACHSTAAGALQSVPFPSGERISGLGTSAVCSVCHQGRAWTGSVDKAAQGVEDDAVSAEISFVNSHYLVAGATRQGTMARGGYEYAGKTYAGPFAHVPQFSSCASCHSPHALSINPEPCTECHKGASEFEQIRVSRQDFDGDGDVAEGIADPIATLHQLLGQAIADYANEVAGAPIIYASSSYPYFFQDTDGDGGVSEGEAQFPNRYTSWTPRLLKAAYNYQFVAKDGGAFSHNPHYALQLLYDSLASLSDKVAVDISSLTRP
ncbi:MAG: polyheme membrane-associated cytochrome C [Rhodobacteraceae bacterium]|nr:polyheme membrane-associated cytochrome C [Paracoccaceae bacterium]